MHGQVQGVFFRDSSREHAERLGLTGWVRNRDDGRVEIEVQGEPGNVEKFVAWTRQGPPAADVAAADLEDESVVGGERGFGVR